MLFRSLRRTWQLMVRALIIGVLPIVGLRGLETGDAFAAAPRVVVALRAGGAASARVSVGQTLAVDVVATTTAAIDAARVTVFAEPTYLRFDGGAGATAFPLLTGVSNGNEMGRVRLDIARASAPWPSGTVTLGTMRFIAEAEGATMLTVVTTGNERTRVAGNREELTLVTTSFAVVIGDPVPTATPQLVPTAVPAVLPLAPVAWRPSAPSGASGSSAVSAGISGADVPMRAPAILTPDALHSEPVPTFAQSGWVGYPGASQVSAASVIPSGFEPDARPVAPAFAEFYAGASGMRLLGRPMGAAMERGGIPVQYFEKGRLELHQDAPDGWKFQLGLLVDELARVFALVPLGGDTSTLTYADVARLSVATRRVSPPDGFSGGVAELPDGSTFVPFDAALAVGPGHIVPGNFWRFLNDPTVFPGGWLHDAGLPVTPVAEAVVTKGAVTRTILVQAFQRTILTFDPLNPSDYVVECANAGTDYLRAIGPG